jgi:ASC-1-like (ASCH) protein
MGTSNFARGNTSRVYAVLMDTEETFKECTECGHKHYDYEFNLETLTNCELCDEVVFDEAETEYRSAEDYEYDDFKEYLRETAQRKVKETTFVYRDESGSDNDRNYCATDLFSIRSSKMYGDIEISVKVIGQIVSAYYEGASLDFSVEFNDEEYTNDEPDFEWLFEYQSEMNKGLQVLQNRKATIWAEKETEKMKNLIEEIFTEVSQPLNVIGTASNGETFYAKAE